MHRRRSPSPRVVAVALALTLLPLAACSAQGPTLTLDQTKDAALSEEQLVSLGAVPALVDVPDFTAGELASLARSPEVVDPEVCREYVGSIGIPGQAVLPSQDVESTDAVVVAPHLDLGDGFVEQALRVLPDIGAAERLVADLRELADACTSFEYGAATNVNRFVTVDTSALPFAGEGHRSTVEVRGTEEVVETDEVYVMRFGNVVATVRGTAERTEPFALTLSDNLRAQY